MTVHKIKDKKTVCGIDIWKNPIEASAYWEDVDCKKCLNKKGEKTANATTTTKV